MTRHLMSDIDTVADLVMSAVHASRTLLSLSLARIVVSDEKLRYEESTVKTLASR